MGTSTCESSQEEKKGENNFGEKKYEFRFCIAHDPRRVGSCRFLMSKAGGGGETAPVMPAAAEAASPEVFAKDSIIAWFRGEFTAANAIIDALCAHLAQIDGGGAAEYEAAFAAINRRRMNWFPVLHMQRFYSIAEVSAELRQVAENRMEAAESAAVEMEEDPPREAEMVVEKRIESEGDLKEIDEAKSVSSLRVSVEGEGEGEHTEEDSSGDSSDRKIHPEINGAGDEGFEEAQTACLEYAKICSDHEECISRPERIKISKGFVAREPVKGHMVNVVKGLKVYEDMFTASELMRISDFINELRMAGHRGELSGETFILFNKQMKGNKREIIQLGAPLFQPTTEDATSNIEPIPPVLEAVIDHLVQWRLIPEGRKPNSCVINFFDEDEFSQPYLKPPHLDNPISTLVLSETTMAFGRVLVSDPNGNYKGSLTLPLKEGSLLVMRGNSADMARHVVCPSKNRRMSITFVRVRPTNNQVDPSAISPTKATNFWQPGSPQPQNVPTGGALVYAPNTMVPSWGLTLRAPVVMFSPSRPMVMGPTKHVARGGTGVFLPWTVGPKRYTKQLPPRIQKRRLPTLPSPIEAM